MSTGRTKIRKSGSDKVFDGIVLVFLTLLLILVLYPLIYIVFGILFIGVRGYLRKGNTVACGFQPGGL